MLLSVGLVGAGVFTVALGLVHLAIPRLVRYGAAIGVDGAGQPTLGTLGLGRLAYGLRRSDLVGITWVMSNAASYVRITIGVVDLAWASGWRSIPPELGAAWIAGWWAIRAAGQLALGHRSGDIAAIAWFGAIAAGHLLVAVSGLNVR